MNIRNGALKILWIEAKPTEIQIKVADKLGIHIDKNDSFLTVLAKIEDTIAEAIRFPTWLVTWTNGC